MEYISWTRKDLIDFMLMFGLNKAMDRLAMAKSVRWYVHVLRREDFHVFENVIKR